MKTCVKNIIGGGGDEDGVYCYHGDMHCPIKYPIGHHYQSPASDILNCLCEFQQGTSAVI